MDIVIRQPVPTISGVKTVEHHVPYDIARRKVDQLGVDYSKYGPKATVLSVYAQVRWGCDHAVTLPDGRHEWVNDTTGETVRLEASL